MKCDPKVLADLNAASGLLATIAEQWRINGYMLRNLGLKSLGKKFYAEDSWHQDIEHHLNTFIRQILNFEGTPQYSIGILSAAGTLVELLGTACATAQAAFDALCVMRRNAWNIRADAVPDEYEHAIQEVQHQVEKMERWLRIMSTTEGIGAKDFVGALVEV